MDETSFDMSTEINSISPRRAKIIEVLEEAGKAMQIRDIVKLSGLDYGNARSALSEMVNMDLLVRVHRGVYDIPHQVQKKKLESPEHHIQEIIQNKKNLKVLL